jgi:DNA-binding XRE family transcriptional regulator
MDVICRAWTSGRLATSAAAVPRPKTAYDPGLARAVSETRIERGMTREDVAPKADVTLNTIARIEQAKSNPTWDTLRRIATALDITIAELAKRAQRRK